MTKLSLCFALTLFAASVAPSQTRTPQKLWSPPAIPPEKGYFVEEIRGGIYWVTDGLYNTMFAIWSNGVVAIDPLPNLGERYLKAIREVTDKPITHVIYSHEHTDHIGAAYLFPKDAVRPSCGNRQVPRWLARDRRAIGAPLRLLRRVRWTEQADLARDHGDG